MSPLMYIEGIIISLKLRCSLGELTNISKAHLRRAMPCKGNVASPYNTAVHERRLCCVAERMSLEGKTSGFQTCSATVSWYDPECITNTLKTHFAQPQTKQSVSEELAFADIVSHHDHCTHVHVHTINKERDGEIERKQSWLLVSPNLLKWRRVWHTDSLCYWKVRNILIKLNKNATEQKLSLLRDSCLSWGHL